MAQVAQQAPAAPAAQTGRLRGVEPDYFTGDRTKADIWKQQFKAYWVLNDNHEVMQSPFYRAICALSLIRGPLVNDWVSDQIDILYDRANRTNNPIARNENVHWTEFIAAFDNAFMDSTKAQQAHVALQQLTMRGEDLDSYVATFKHLAKVAGYDLANLGTVHLFAKGLKKNLRIAIMNRDTQPTTFIEWVNQAQLEQQKFARRQAFERDDLIQYRWTTPKQTNGHHHHRQERRHPNDIPVPMDVDPPVFTRVRRAYTDEDKNRFRQEGRCFNCDQRGHMARECPNKKKQQYGQSNRTDQPKSRYDQAHKPNQFKRKSFGSKPMGQGFRKRNQFTYKPQIRSAHIEDVEEGNGEEDKEYIESLAARTAKLSDDQREQWVDEMHHMGINF